MPEIDSLVQHMGEWEIHSLRGLVTTMVIEVQLYARRHPECEGAARLADKLVELKQHQLDAQLLELQGTLAKEIVGTREHV